MKTLSEIRPLSAYIEIIYIRQMSKVSDKDQIR